MSKAAKGIDVEALKGQAAGRWRELLSTLGGVPADVLDGKNHPCPRCGGTDRFRMIDVAAGSLLLQSVLQAHRQWRRHRGANVVVRVGLQPSGGGIGQASWHRAGDGGPHQRQAQDRRHLQLRR